MRIVVEFDDPSSIAALFKILSRGADDEDTDTELEHIANYWKTRATRAENTLEDAGVDYPYRWGRSRTDDIDPNGDH